MVRFRRRTSEQLDQLVGRLADLEARLEAERAEKAALTARLAELERNDGVDDLTARLRGLLEATAVASEQAARAVDGRFAELATRLDAMDARVGALDAGQAEALAHVRARLDEVTTALTRQLEELDGELDAAARRVDERLAAADALVAGRVAAVEQTQAERLAAAEQTQAERLAATARAVEAEVAAVRQAHLDALADVEARLGEAVSSEELVGKADELRANQARLANELVRFQLAIRQEVAGAVERLGVRGPSRPRPD